MSKDKKVAISLQILARIFRILEKVSPRMAGRLALYLFLHPPRHQRPEREQKCYDAAKRSFIQVEGHKVAVFEWGEGPIVWIMHGWAGRASQLSSFIKALVASGYKVIGMDAPGHGDSDGKESSVILFEHSLEALYKKYGKAYAYIGHSLGGAVGFFAMKNKIPFEKYIAISSPTIAELILHEAFDKLGAGQKSIDAMCELIQERVGAPFVEYTATYWAQFAPDIPILIIHDKNDKEAGILHAETQHKLLPQSELYITEGLGHVRILRDEKVIQKVLSFIQS
jgi:pimeloyl-ACP methyl ester carboxylesterase